MKVRQARMSACTICKNILRLAYFEGNTLHQIEHFETTKKVLVMRLPEAQACFNLKQRPLVG